MDNRPTHAWQSLYPPLPCHAHGWLEVGDGHAVYWEECGNPLGRPALFVHGGPGAGCSADDRRWFDPQRYRIVLFDQRGAGRSRPLGRLVANTTAHLVRDIEVLRRHLQIERWLLFGGSWGATLALAYAQSHPERVQALVLRGVFTATAREQRWLYAPKGAATLHPAAWLRLNAVLAAPAGADLPGAMAARLHCGDASAEQPAAQAWLAWEQALMANEPPHSPAAQAPAAPRPCDDAAALAMARIGVHFARHAYFLEEDQLLAQAARLHGLPGLIVQGANDQVTPPAAARALHRAWSGSRLQQVETAGHASCHPALARLLIRATDHFGAPDNGGTRRQAGAHPGSALYPIAAPLHGKENL